MATLQKTLVLDYNMIVTGIRTRRQILADRTAVVADTDYEFREITMPAGQQIAIAGIVALFFLKCNAALQLNLNNTGFMVVNELFVMTGAIPNLTIFNASTAPVSCIICNI